MYLSDLRELVNGPRPKIWGDVLKAGFGDKNTPKECGAPERIRTTNLLIRSQMLYPVELRAPEKNS